MGDELIKRLFTISFYFNNVSIFVLVDMIFPKNTSAWKPEFIFLFCALFFGILYVFINPPFQVPDEPNHFLRAYQISEGNFISEKKDNRIGGYLPQSLDSLYYPFHSVIYFGEKVQNAPWITEIKVLPLNSEKRKFIDFNNTALYSPVCYLPQSIGIFILRQFSVPALWLVYSGRIGALIFWSLIVFYAIKIIPFGKWLFTFLALLPLSLCINVSLSADSVTNALCFLFIAVVLNAYCSEKILETKILLLLLLLLLLLPFTKIIYATLLPLVLIIHPRKYGPKPRRILILVLFFALPLISLYTSSRMIDHLYITHDQYNPAYSEGLPLVPGADARLQTQRVLHNPDIAFKVIIPAIKKFITYHIPAYVAGLGWQNIFPPGWFTYLLYVLIIFITIADDNSTNKLKWTGRSYFILIFLITLFAVFLSQFLSWTAYGADSMQEVQGRYLVPFYPLFFLALSGLLPFKIPKLSMVVLLVSVLSNVYCLIMLWNRYY